MYTIKKNHSPSQPLIAASIANFPLNFILTVGYTINEN